MWHIPTSLQSPAGKLPDQYPPPLVEDAPESGYVATCSVEAEAMCVGLGDCCPLAIT